MTSVFNAPCVRVYSQSLWNGLVRRSVMKFPDCHSNSIPWRKFPCRKTELRLDITLKCGQSFRWSRSEDDESIWIGVLKNRIWLITQDSEFIYFKNFPKSEEEDEAEVRDLKDYFQLNVDLEYLYEAWSKVDSTFEKISREYPGVRMLRQDPVENLFSFICSSNNNIKRISNMVEHLSSAYGTFLGRLKNKDYFSFPSVSQLCEDKKMEENLRKNGFGYRAGYIVKTAENLMKKGGAEFLLSLRSSTYEEAKEQLLEFTGIGPKVADCILLMSLDKTSAIPVDTHMFQIAARDYLPHLKGKKSVTSKIYAEIGDHFRDLYGDYAGWAHSVLFSADLKHLKEMKEEKNEVPPKKIKRD